MNHFMENACEEIDAGFFSGDAFHSREAVAEMERYMGRWGLEMESIKHMLNEREAEESLEG